jgi:hypothetical protein
MASYRPKGADNMSAMTKEEFKTRWESNDNGGGITYDDIANCAVTWGISRTPKTRRIDVIRYQVLVAAGTVDAEEFKPVETTA